MNKILEALRDARETARVETVSMSQFINLPSSQSARRIFLMKRATAETLTLEPIETLMGRTGLDRPFTLQLITCREKDQYPHLAVTADVMIDGDRVVLPVNVPSTLRPFLIKAVARGGFDKIGYERPVEYRLIEGWSLA